MALKIFYKGILNTHHSWAIVGTELLLALEKIGCEVHAESSNGTKKVDRRIKHLLKGPCNNPAFSMAYSIPNNIRHLPGPKRVSIYNYETTILPAGWARLINESADLFLPSSKFAKMIFLRNGVDDKKTEILPHGINTDNYNPDIPPYTFKTKKFVFLAVSSPHARKGLDILLEAFGEEFASIEPVCLVIKTSLPKQKQHFEVDVRKILDKVRAKRVLPEVRVLLDAVPSLASLYRGAHCFVNPSRSECFSIPALEAVACKTPVITTSYGGQTDFLTSESSYLLRYKLVSASKNLQYWHYHPKALIAQPDKEHLKQMMRHVFENYAEAKRRAERAYEIIPNYTWEKVGEQLIEHCDKHGIIRASQRPTPTSKNNKKVQNTGKVQIVTKESLQTETIPTSQIQSNENITISSFSIILNEQKNIKAMLENISPLFDEIVLVDGGSEDETVKIITQYIKQTKSKHIKLFVRPQEGDRYSKQWNQTEQRNFALKQCTSDWVMMLDADERLDAAFKKIVRDIVRSRRSLAYAMPKYHYWQSEDKIRVDGWWFPNYSYRLWKNFEGIKYEKKARHCQPIIVNMPCVLNHRKLEDRGPFLLYPIHHLHYVNPAKYGDFFRANDKDVKTFDELKKNLKVKSVLPLNKALTGTPVNITPNITKAEVSNKLINKHPAILYYYQNFPFYSGGRYHLWTLAVAMARSGIRVHMVTDGKNLYDKDFPVPPLMTIEKIGKIRSNTEPQHLSGFDAVFATPAGTGLAALNYAQKHNIKLISTLLETPNQIREGRNTGAADESYEYWKNYKKALINSDYITVSTKLGKKKLLEWISSIDPKKVGFAPPIINIEKLSKRPIKMQHEITFVSRLAKHKNPDHIFQAMSEIKNPPAINIIGWGNKEKIQKKFPRLKFNTYTNITDASKFEIIKRSKLLVTPSFYEGFGMSPAESFYCKRPVVSYPLSVFKEVYGKTIYYAKKGNVQDLKKKVEQLLTNDKLRQEKAEEGHKRIQGKYDITTIGNRLANVVRKLTLPKFSICTIALNEEEYIENVLRNFYDWECCHQIIIVEGAVKLYPKDNVKKGHSTDRTIEIIKNFPDPQNKIVLVQGEWKNKMEQRSQYAKRITGDYMFVVDADECYIKADLDILKNEVLSKPNVELWRFNQDPNPSRRGIIHFWHGIDKHVIGGYWNVPHNRIYKFSKGLRYTTNHNHPAKKNGKAVVKDNVKTETTKIKCYHLGFSKCKQNMADKIQFYKNRGEGKEKNPQLRKRRQMYVDCRDAWFNWKPGNKLPHGAKVLPYNGPLPEVLQR